MAGWNLDEVYADRNNNSQDFWGNGSSGNSPSPWDNGTSGNSTNPWGNDASVNDSNPWKNNVPADSHWDSQNPKEGVSVQNDLPSRGDFEYPSKSVDHSPAGKSSIFKSRYSVDKITVTSSMLETRKKFNKQKTIMLSLAIGLLTLIPIAIFSEIFFLIYIGFFGSIICFIGFGAIDFSKDFKNYILTPILVSLVSFDQNESEILKNLISSVIGILDISQKWTVVMQSDCFVGTLDTSYRKIRYGFSDFKLVHYERKRSKNGYYTATVEDFMGQVVIVPLRIPVETPVFLTKKIFRKQYHLVYGKDSLNQSISGQVWRLLKGYDNLQKEENGEKDFNGIPVLERPEVCTSAFLRACDALMESHGVKFIICSNDLLFIVLKNKRDPFECHWESMYATIRRVVRELEWVEKTMEPFAREEII